MKYKRRKIGIDPGTSLYLKDRNISQIHILFSGGGDSGQIDDINYIIGGKDFSPTTAGVSNSINNYIEEICYDLLEGIGDWYNNDGGQGSMTIDTSDWYYEIYAEYNPEERGHYDDNDEWIPDANQDDPYEETYEGHITKTC